MVLVDAIIANLASLVPLKVVYSYQQGVRFHKGIDTALLEAGLYWYVPFVQKIEVVDTVPSVMDLPNQPITTKDDIIVTISANVTYEITDARLMWTKVQDFEDSLRGHIAARAREWSYAELLAGQKELEKSLKGTLTTYVKDWGVRVLDVKLTAFVKARPSMIISDGTLTL
jgi:regulator of protease activity HflC (stomatin/prohibitin superfamily)